MVTRIYEDEHSKEFLDDVLETVFRQITEWGVFEDDTVTIMSVLDPYTKACFEENSVAFADALTNIDTAVKWCTQFGELRIWPIPTGGYYAQVMFNDDPKACCVFGANVHQATILAGVQVLREIAHITLNPITGEYKN